MTPRTVVPASLDPYIALEWLNAGKEEFDLAVQGVTSNGLIEAPCVCGCEYDACDCNPIFDREWPGTYVEGAEVEMRCECDVCGHESAMVVKFQEL